jgi:hypothetical protein
MSNKLFLPFSAPPWTYHDAGVCGGRTHPH